ncbi:MAG: RpiB/LacA/LacB family sugar-phosphate isomerase [Verrucomicrobiales bacterium]|jgi:RpiB/LacA/LacB family sugar-phosphate isomerase
MLKHMIIEPEEILVLEPHAPLEATDFEELAREIAPYIADHGKLPGLMIHAEAFPGWANFDAFIAHMRFIKSHHQNIVRLAMVSDSDLLADVSKITAHLVHAQVKHFLDSEYADALQWLKAATGKLEMKSTSSLSLESCCLLKATEVVGIAADHGGHELKGYLAGMLRQAGVEVVDFGAQQLVPDDDFPDYVVPLARAVASGRVERGVAICGSGVGACVIANKVRGVRACLIYDPFSAHQGVEDDDLNLICLGGLVVGHALAWELVRIFLCAQFSGKERRLRRLKKVMDLENMPSQKLLRTTDRAIEAPGHPVEHTSNEASPLKIFLIRHGETEWSITGQHTGRTDLPLTASGEDEVRQWGKQLCRIPFSHVLTSPLLRARQTCELVGMSEIAESEPDLVEWDYGDYDGVTSAEIRTIQPDWNVFRDGSPNGELPVQVAARADRLIARLRTMDGNIALFSHGHLGAVLTARWIGLPIAEAEHFRLNTASLSILGDDPHHPGMPVIELWNSTPLDVSDPISCSDARLRLSMKRRAIEQWENEGGETRTPDQAAPYFPAFQAHP